MSWPRKRMRPARGVSMPAMVRIRLDLPAPLAPTMATSSPSLGAKRDAVERLGVAVVTDRGFSTLRGSHAPPRRGSIRARPGSRVTSLGRAGGDDLRRGAARSTRLDSAITARMTCSMSRMVRPSLALSSRNSATMWSVSVGRRPAITSSSSRMRGPVASARATSSRLRSGSVSEAAMLVALAAEAQLLDHLRRPSALASRTLGAGVERADDDVLHHGQPGERLHQLERAADAGAADLVGRASRRCACRRSAPRRHPAR